MTMSVCLQGGQVLAPDGSIGVADLAVADGTIDVTASSASIMVGCTGYHVLPGIVDVHGDAFERELHPRPGVNIAPDIAMASVDRQLLANGITTAFHGLTLSWESGERSLEAARIFMNALRDLRSGLLADHRVQLRWETFAHEALEDIGEWLSWSPTPALAFNDHTTATLEKVEAGNHKNLDQWAQRTGLTNAQYLAAVEEAAGVAPHVPDKVAEVAVMARKHGAVMLSHDEKTTEGWNNFRKLGATVCEFPLRMSVAANAIQSGEHVILGGPNVIRGGSHTGALSAEEAISAGRCTVLASDYYYPSLFRAAEYLVERGVLSLAKAWRIVSCNPAQAMGMSDRGMLDIGKRADVVVVDCNRRPWRLVHAIVGGTLVSFGH